MTIRTTSGIPRDALPATLETLLRMNGATMVNEGSLWKVVPQTAAVRGNVTPQLGNSTRALPQGYSVQIVPLRYVGVREMLRILEPFAKDAQAIRVDDVRNLLILSGHRGRAAPPARDDRHVRHRLDVGNVGRRLHAAERRRQVGVAGARQGHRRPQHEPVHGHPAHHPDRADERAAGDLAATRPTSRRRRSGSSGSTAAAAKAPRFYVYNLQNQRAERVAPLLQQAFTGRTTQATRRRRHRRSRPARRRARSSRRRRSRRSPTIVPNTPAASAAPAAAAAAGAAVGAAAGARRSAAAMASASCATSRSSPTRTRTRVLIVATPSEYSIIEQALKKLDVAVAAGDDRGDDRRSEADR